MIVDLELTVRRENPILAPFLDQLGALVDYVEVTLYRPGTDCFTFLAYRGPVPQTHTLSLSIPAGGLDDWGRALETGKPVISEETDGTTIQAAAFRQSVERLVGSVPGTASTSLLAVPLVGEDSTPYLLVLGHDEPQFYTSEHADRVLRFALEHLRTIENSARHAELAQQAAEAEMLLSLLRAIVCQPDPSAVLTVLADEARNLTFARSAFILALEDSELVLEAFSGERPAYPSDGEAWTVDGATIKELDGVISSRRGDITAWLGAPAAAWLGQRDFVAAPLRHTNQVTGLLVVVDKRLGIYDKRDERRLTIMASLTSCFLLTGRLYYRATRMAVLKEREQLSQELHDELAQTLSYLKMQASLVEQKVRANDLGTALTHLAESKAVLDVAYSSIREAIFDLRYPVGAGSGVIVPLLYFIVDRRSDSELNIALETLDPTPDLAPEVEFQLMRIVQEALTNVRRHAAAKQVKVKLEREPGTIVVRITDDGKGFDVDAVLAAEGERFGLQIMRERAETFGGRVEIQSTPGSGSEVTVYIPESQA